MCSEKVLAILRDAVKRLRSNTSDWKSDPFSLRTSDIVQCFKTKQNFFLILFYFFILL